MQIQTLSKTQKTHFITLKDYKQKSSIKKKTKLNTQVGREGL